MPNCPRCYKFFQDDKGVIFHLAQPKSACRANSPVERVVVRVPQQDQGIGTDSESDPGREFEFESAEPDNDLSAQWDMDITEPDGDPLPDDIELEPDQSSASRWVVDRHTVAGQVKSDGKTFLARFEMDQFSMYRKLNLYYPFASLQDWQMANFLLTSRLSMKAIDNFLSLQLVCSPFLIG